MIRERVDIHGRIRPMEPPEEIPALQLRPEQIGIIKQAPALRWAEGQGEWDVTFRQAAKRAIKKRQKIETKWQTMLEHAKEQGFIMERDHSPTVHHRGPTSQSVDTEDGTIQEDRRWGPLDLADENPPPSAIAKRRDTVCHFGSQSSPS